MEELISEFELGEEALGNLTSAVQLGFIFGTLLFALFTIADRFSPVHVFFVSAMLGSLFNLGLVLSWNSGISLIAFRFMTGFFLAGIYPVGMKIASDHFEKGLGRSLSFLVGALVLGTALPHLIKGLDISYSWRYVIYATSSLATIGGILMILLVENGPFRKKGTGLKLASAFQSFSDRGFRSAALGYFGHMWELYSFWGFIPVIIAIYCSGEGIKNWNISILSFLVIAVGSVACMIGGILANKKRPGLIAFWSLFISGICCLLSPLAFGLPSSFFFMFLLIWGAFVISDSPLFSTLVANSSNPETRGSALTIVNSIGFAITIPSIQLVSLLLTIIPQNMVFLALLPGPVLGLVFFIPQLKGE